MAEVRRGLASWKARWRCRRALPGLVRQLAIMLRAGLDLSSALNALARGASHPDVAQLIRDLLEQVEQGQPLARALEQRPDIFPPLLIAGVASAEASGTLAPALERTAATLEDERRLRASVSAMLTYPAALVLLSIAVVAALMVFVLPRFEEIFATAGVPLPWSTEFLLALSRLITGHPWLVLLILAGLVAGAVAATRSAQLRDRLRRHALNMPVLGPVLRSLELSRLLQNLGTMLECGVPLLEAIELARSGTRYADYRALMDRLRESALQGQGLASPLRDSWLVPPEVAEMVATAERTGSLAWVLQFVGRQYQEQAETRLRTVVRMAEPALILSLGAVVAFIVSSIMLPLFDLSQVAAAG